MKIFNKLVRDNIPRIIELEDRVPITRILNDSRYKAELLKKLVEEANEVLEAKNNRENMIQELGDLLEVISSTVKAFDLDMEEILRLKEKRKHERGGFDKKIFLESIC